MKTRYFIADTEHIDRLVFAIIGTGFLDLINGRVNPENIVNSIQLVQCDLFNAYLNNHVTDKEFADLSIALDDFVEFCGGRDYSNC